ncbi:MAG: MarR family winged helix-turn-helix transcriptional regulator, partial [Streptosporangiaceae bacterium]
MSNAGTAATAATGAAPDEAGPPSIDVTRLRVAIARVSRSLRRHELAGLTPTQLSALSTVDKAGPLRLGDLAAAEKIAPSTLTRLVTVLEDRGYVRRGAVPGDARAA